MEKKTDFIWTRHPEAWKWVKDRIEVFSRSPEGAPDYLSLETSCILSIVCCTSGDFDVICIPTPFLNRKSQWSQPSAKVWVRVKSQPSPALNGMSDLQT